MRKVAIPLEITEISSEILPVIRRVFHPHETKLTLLTVHEPFTPIALGTGGAPMMDALLSISLLEQNKAEWEARQQQAEERLQAIGQTLRADGYRVNIAILEGEIVPAIADFVNAHNFDILAMATFGREGLDRLLNGSIAESLLRRVTTPMLLIRHQPEREPVTGKKLPVTLANAPLAT
jgi:nucleotide-binding universal stress UspA family protein